MNATREPLAIRAAAIWAIQYIVSGVFFGSRRKWCSWWNANGKEHSSRRQCVGDTMTESERVRLRNMTPDEINHYLVGEL